MVFFLFRYFYFFFICLFTFFFLHNFRCIGLNLPFQLVGYSHILFLTPVKKVLFAVTCIPWTKSLGTWTACLNDYQLDQMRCIPWTNFSCTRYMMMIRQFKNTCWTIFNHIFYNQIICIYLNCIYFIYYYYFFFFFLTFSKPI